MAKLPESEIVQLVRAAQAGDAESFGKIHDEFVDPIFRFCFFRVGQTEDAEDLTEQTFLRAWQKISLFRKRKNTPFSSWLFRIAHNSVVDFWREKKKKQTLDLEEVADFLPDQKPENDPQHFANLRLEQRRLAQALQKLPEAQSQILILRFVNDLSNSQISEILGKPESTVRVQIFRGLARLREILTSPRNKKDF